MSVEADERSFSHSIEIVGRGYATPHRLTGVPGKLSGCIYREDGSKVEASERLGGVKGDLVISHNPDRVEIITGATALEGRSLYLGHHMGGHYGHFITEGLAALWALEDLPVEQFDHFVLHPFVFDATMTPYMRYCFDSLGIPPERVTLIGSEPLAFDEIVVPERLFRLNHSGDPRLQWVYRTIAAHGDANDAGTRPTSAKVYLSRRKYSRTTLDRVVANEVDIEAAFAQRGFAIVYPEELSFAEQLELYSAAEMIAGISGSNLHNCVFMQPGSTVIELGDPRYGGEPAPNQTICNNVSAVRAHFIPFEGHQFGARMTVLFRISAVDRGLVRILGPADHSNSRYAWQKISHLPSVTYRAVRPSAGRWIRELIRRIRP